MREPGAHRHRAADGHIGRRRHRQPRGCKTQHQMVGILAHRQMLAFAHHVPDIAEHEEIAGHRARQARDIVGVAGDEPGGKTLGKMRRRIRFRHRVADALRQFLADGDVLVARKLDEAVGEVGIVSRQRRLDILRDQRGVIPQSRIEPDSRRVRRARPAPPEWQRRRAHAATAARTRAAHAHAIATPRPNRSATVSSRKTQCFRLPQHGVPLLGHNGPDERRASLGRQDCVEFA